MKRIALGAVTGLSVWFASALAAEAQVITPTGPLLINGGDTSYPFSGTVTLPYANFFWMRINVFQNGQSLNYSNTYVPNPGTTTYNFAKTIPFNAPAQGGVILDFQITIVFGGSPYVQPDFHVTVKGTRPPSKVLTVRPSGTMAVQAVDRDRRREQ